MDVLHQTLNQVLASAPTLTLEGVITRKLHAQGVKFPKKLPAKLAEHILSGNTQPFQYRGRTQPKDLSLSFDEADAEEAARSVDHFLEVQLPRLVPKLAEQLSKTILKSLKRSWVEEQILQQADLAGFRSRMEETWGEPLGKLRMLLTMVREWCGEAHKAPGSRRVRTGLRSQKLMVRLLVRSCQVTDEIICLLENGFADGAMARWRTLHEIGVVAAVISKHGEGIAERYVAHQAVESRRGMQKYMDCHKHLGYKPLAVRTIAKIERAYSETVAQYGETFKSEYGWAAHHLKKVRPTFADLEAEAGHAKMRTYYQMGNNNVHAGVKSMYVRLGLLGDYSGLLAGRSNAGLTDPGQNAAHTLTQIAILVCMSAKMDDLVVGNVVRMVRDEIPRSFLRADKRLRNKHRAVLKR
jgi:hypothetical protein